MINYIPQLHKINNEPVFYEKTKNNLTDLEMNLMLQNHAKGVNVRSVFIPKIWIERQQEEQSFNKWIDKIKNY